MRLVPSMLCVIGVYFCAELFRECKVTHVIRSTVVGRTLQALVVRARCLLTMVLVVDGACCAWCLHGACCGWCLLHSTGECTMLTGSSLPIFDHLNKNTGAITYVTDTAYRCVCSCSSPSIAHHPHFASPATLPCLLLPLWHPIMLHVH